MAESRQGCEQQRATGQTVKGKLWICGGGSAFGLLHVSVTIEERRGTEGRPGSASRHEPELTLKGRLQGRQMSRAAATSEGMA